MAHPPLPQLDDDMHRRLFPRYGTAIDAWLADLPPQLAALAERWALRLESVVPHGHIAVVIRCQTADGRPEC